MKDALDNTKKLYPFKKWREAYFEYDMHQYSEENCAAAEKIFDDLIQGLNQIGMDATEESKVALFEIAINTLNDLNDGIPGFIETGEREDLCDLIDAITKASGLNPEDYADGDGIADLWREW
ncbi:MAG: hypothetical protein MRY83_08735 [Flavobacteriales bacterium]|nr:hypothetical protein [Flavobacteriales bacterium]